MHTFNQHTEVHSLGIGPAIRCSLEHWDPICEFIKDLAKEDNKSPKSNSQKQVSVMLIVVEKDVTKATLEYILNNFIPTFEGFLHHLTP